MHLSILLLFYAPRTTSESVTRGSMVAIMEHMRTEVIKPELPLESYPRPLVTVDVVLLTLVGQELKFAVVRRAQDPFAGRLALPGGVIHTEEDSNGPEAAARILLQKTGLVSPYLEQLATFTGVSRDPRGWSLSVAYYALVPQAVAEEGRSDVEWLPVEAPGSLPFDHLEIVASAVQRVRSKTAYSSLPVHLMPEKFSLPQLKRTYEQVMQTTLDKRAFAKIIKELDVLEPLNEKTVGLKQRPAQLYTLAKRLKGKVSLAATPLG